MKKLLFTALLLVSVVGCGGSPTLDTTSEASFKSSIEAMTDKLSDADKQKLAAVVAATAMGEVFAAAASDRELEMHTAAKELHGLTAEQIIAKAKELAE